MAAGGNEVLHDPNETLYYISDNEVTANAPLDEDEAARESRRRKNRQREWRRQEAAARARGARDLHGAFDAAADPVFNSPIATMVEATLRLMRLPCTLETD